MILLSARELARQFDAEPVFENVTFDVRRGERIGLVGPNGTGKTTLLNILAGLDEPDRGEVNKPAAAAVALLEQHADFQDDRTLRQEVERGLDHLYGLQRQSHDLAEQMARAEDRELERLKRQFDEIQHELEHHDAYAIDHRVDEVLHGLGFQPDEYDRPLRTFSGGQQNRALLARMLLEAPDVMLLDEPTNHLDIAATEWLESYLCRTQQSLILVSHDRFFLDRVTTRILELHGGRLTDYKGNFTDYWHQREERNKVLERTQEKQQEFIARTEDFIRRNKYGQKHAQAADREKKLERLERVETLQDFAQLSMTFGEPERSGDWVIDAEGLSKGFDQPLFENMTLRVHRGDRIGILGPNGSGKTTLLRTLIGELTPDTGTVREGTNVRFGYFDQQLRRVPPDADAIEAVRPAHDLDVTPGEIRSLLARFGIRGDLVFQSIGNMSGGERSKVALARLAALNANVLILDEPTNHLDLWALDALETALREFAGTTLFVSHDRYFVDRVATSVIVFEADRWRIYDGNYSEYVAFTRSQQREQQTAAGSATRSEPASRAQGPSPSSESDSRSDNGRQSSQSGTRRKRQFAYRKVEDLEIDIAEHEERLERLQADLSSPDVHRDGDRVKRTMQEYESTQQALEQLYAHWEEALELN